MRLIIRGTLARFFWLVLATYPAWTMSGAAAVVESLGNSKFYPEKLQAHNPFNYAEGRGLEDYNQILNLPNHSLIQFIQTFSKATLIWMDSGAGSGRAQTEFLQDRIKSPGSEGCTLIGFSKFLPPNFKELGAISASTEGTRHLYKYYPIETEKAFLKEYESKVDLITDIHGAISYSPNLASILDFFGRYLRKGGRAYIFTPDTKIIFVGVQGENLHFSDFLKSVRGFNIIMSPRKSALFLERNDDDVFIPQFKHLVTLETHNPPPIKIYQLDQTPGAEYSYDPLDQRIVTLEQLRMRYDEHYNLIHALKTAQENEAYFLQMLENPNSPQFDKTRAKNRIIQYKTAQSEITAKLETKTPYKTMSESELLQIGKLQHEMAFRDRSFTY